MTALALALREAGVVPPAERLKDIAHRVLAMSAEEWAAAISEPEPIDKGKLIMVAKAAVSGSIRNWDGAKDAFYKAVRHDAALLWALFEPYRLQAVQKLLTEAAAELREKERDRLAATAREFQQVNGVGRQSHDSQVALTRPVRSRAGMEAASNVARLSLLDTFRANGRAIGDLTPAEANAWAGSRERDARFVRLLTANLPPDQPIRKYRTPDDAQAMYEEAGESGGA